MQILNHMIIWTLLPYITAKQYMCLKQIKQFEYENNVKYEQAFLNTYNDSVENGYKLFML